MGRHRPHGQGRRRHARLAAHHPRRPVPHRRPLGGGNCPANRLQLLFRSASALHQNFYEDDMPEGTVANGLDDVEEIVGLLQAVID